MLGFRIDVTKRTGFGLAIVAALIIAGIVAGIIFPRDSRNAELMEIREELDSAALALNASEGEVARLESTLAEVEGELADTQATLAETEAALAKTEVALATAPPQPEQIFRQVGTWIYSDKITAEADSIIYWGSTISALESMLSIEAEGDFSLTEAVPTLVIVCYAEGTRRIWINNIPLEPIWNEERERTEYDIAYRISPTVRALPIGEKGAQWHVNQEFDSVDRWTVFPTLENLLYLQLKHTEQIDLALTGLNGESLELTFVVTGAFDTRIQPNLDQCGNYY